MSKAASAVALRKGLWRDKQGFSSACPAVAGRRTLVRRGWKPAENAAHRKNNHLWMETKMTTAPAWSVLPGIF